MFEVPHDSSSSTARRENTAEFSNLTPSAKRMGKGLPLVLSYFSLSLSLSFCSPFGQARHTTSASSSGADQHRPSTMSTPAAPAVVSSAPDASAAASAPQTALDFNLPKGDQFFFNKRGQRLHLRVFLPAAGIKYVYVKMIVSSE